MSRDLRESLGCPCSQQHPHGAFVGVLDQRNYCKSLQDFTPESVFLENIHDLAHTLAQIMIICGLHECKALKAVPAITYAFLHYDQVCYCIDTIPKKRIRKEDLCKELIKNCLMNSIEAKLAYAIVKRGFKAFYFKPREYNPLCPPAYSEECIWIHAGKKSAESYSRFEILPCEIQRDVETQIKIAYKRYFERMEYRRSTAPREECNCCYCTKMRGYQVYVKEKKPAKKSQHKCPLCCKKKKKVSKARVAKDDTCPVCMRPLEECVCQKYDFELDWVKSIWERADFTRYYENYIDENRPDTIEYRCTHAHLQSECRRWFNPPWLHVYKNQMPTENRNSQQIS
ncbi:uncharacterized protein LOC119680940 [Teleopsis dalmanni]|uniref:uncharacterized protein LOC119680940 n=1 Tax=Teleopsis dalmanni TaxID=139649 RepID=UPI0018CF94FF|nr:uncharacterized protein LOC119680940 [Teleopsis dalmanni]